MSVKTQQGLDGSTIGFRDRYSDGELIPPIVRAVISQCEFCCIETVTLLMDNSAEEYAPSRICLDCIGKLFDAFENKMLAASYCTECEGT